MITTIQIPFAACLENVTTSQILADKTVYQLLTLSNDVNFIMSFLLLSLYMKEPLTCFRIVIIPLLYYGNAFHF